MNCVETERTRTDRCEKYCPLDLVCPPDSEIFSSTFVSDCLAFNVKRQIKTLNCTTKLICNCTKDSTEQLDALKSLADQIVEDTRLADHLDSGLISDLVEFLDGNKSPQFQYYSAVVFETIVSNKGKEFKDRSVPYLLNLILSPKGYVQTTALFTLANIANVFPESCDFMIKNGVLRDLESLISNEYNHYELLESGCKLLTAFCRMKPQLLSDKMDIVVNTISTAIGYVHESVLIQGCLALSLLSDQGLVKIGTGVDRLLDLINYSVLQIVISALRTIGNYVRWGNDEEIQFMIRLSSLAVVGELLPHKCTIVRKEACWIISNVTAVANSSQMQDIYDLGLIDMLLERVRSDEFDVKEVAARAISNVFHGSDQKLFECMKDEYFPILDDLCLLFSDDPQMAALCSKILELDNTYLTKILEPVSTHKNGRKVEHRSLCD
ncbi:importin subunit alpha-4-like [Apium graveolens]|uniref:importin subunit alpha-4-like n=1 Tax=Apium graveolens TaxID=4045 RepID=UPI003D7A3B41